MGNYIDNLDRSGIMKLYIFIQIIQGWDMKYENAVKNYGNRIISFAGPGDSNHYNRKYAD